MTKYVRNVEHNGVEIYFDGIPESSIREELKNNGFRWHRAKKCWYSYASSYNMKFAMQICNKCNSGLSGYKLYDDFPRKKPIEEWEEKSIYRKYGYTVSQEEGLSDANRRNILKYMISLGVVTKKDIVYFLDSQIRLRNNNSSRDYSCAIEKWERDLKYVQSEEFESYCALVGEVKFG